MAVGLAQEAADEEHLGVVAGSVIAVGEAVVGGAPEGVDLVLEGVVEEDGVEILILHVQEVVIGEEVEEVGTNYGATLFDLDVNYDTTGRKAVIALTVSSFHVVFS